MACILTLGVLWTPQAFTSDSEKPSQEQGTRTVKILALGDSLTAGYQIGKEKAFVSVLERLLKENGFPVEIVNAGVSGDTAAQGLARLDWSLKRAGPFDAAIVGLGANDGLRRNSVDAMQKSLTAIVKKLKAQDIQVFLLGMRLPTNFEEGYRNSFEKTYPNLAKQEAVALYPFVLDGVALDKNYNLSDLIHPNEKGHELIANRLKDWLLEEKAFQALF